MIRLLGAFLILQLLSACAAQQSWYNSGLDNQVVNSRFVIDRGECQGMALQRAPVPNSTANYNQGYTSQVRMMSSSGQTYNGQITTQAGGSALTGNLGPGAVEGYLAAEAYNRAQQARDNLFASCMYQRGWQLK